MSKPKLPERDAPVQIEVCYPRGSWELCFHPSKRWTSHRAELFTRSSEQLPVAPFTPNPAGTLSIVRGGPDDGANLSVLPLSNYCPPCHSVAAVEQSEQISTPTFAFSHVIERKEGNRRAEVTFLDDLFWGLYSERNTIFECCYLSVLCLKKLPKKINFLYKCILNLLSKCSHWSYLGQIYYIVSAEWQEFVTL